MYLPFTDLDPQTNERAERPTNARCTKGTCGKGPAGETCGSCAHLVRIGNSGSRTYLKCGLVRNWWTHGPGTDILARWAACEFWERASNAVSYVRVRTFAQMVANVAEAEDG